MAARRYFWSRVRKRFEEIIKLPAVETNSESKLSIQCRNENRTGGGIVSIGNKKIEKKRRKG